MLSILIFTLQEGVGIAGVHFQFMRNLLLQTAANNDGAVAGPAAAREGDGRCGDVRR